MKGDKRTEVWVRTDVMLSQESKMNPSMNNAMQNREHSRCKVAIKNSAAGRLYRAQ